MSTNSIIMLIKKILTEELDLEDKELELEKTLLESGIDSITLMMLIVYIENELSIEIDMTEGLNDEYSQMTVNTLVRAICNKMEC